jgi:hypothetical protein
MISLIVYEDSCILTGNLLFFVIPYPGSIFIGNFDRERDARALHPIVRCFGVGRALHFIDNCPSSVVNCQLFRGCSSAGRAPRSQRGGRRFDPDQLHGVVHRRLHASPLLAGGMALPLRHLYHGVNFGPSPAQLYVAQPRQVRKEATVGYQRCDAGELGPFWFAPGNPGPLPACIPAPVLLC